MLIFWEMTSRWMPYSALLGSTVDTCYCQSTSSWVLFPYTAHCLVLNGTCYASVYGVVEFQVGLGGQLC